MGFGQLGELKMKKPLTVGGRASKPLAVSARAYIAGVSAAALLVALLVTRWSLPSAGLLSLLVVSALGALAHAYPIQGFRHQAYQVTLPFIVLAAATFNGLELAAFIVAIHVVEQVRLRRPLYIQWFNTCD